MPKEQASVYLVDGLRTPWLTSNNSIQNTSSADLITTLSRQLLVRQPFHASDIDTIFVASSTPIHSENLAHSLAQRLRCNAIPHYFTANGTLTGHLALSEAIQKISHQQQQLILLAGVDTFALPNIESTGLASANSMGNLLRKIHHVQTFVGQIPKEKNAVNTEMALIEHAEKLATQHLISPDQMSEYAQLSRRRLQYAQRNNLLKMISPIYYPDATIQKGDQGVSKNSTHQQKDTIPLLSEDALPVHANGASSILIASESAVKQYNLPVLATLITPIFSSSKDSSQENTPNNAITKLLDSHKLSMNDIDFWEYHESSATDILVAKQQAEESTFTSMKNVNIDGGSLALGSAPCANVFREIIQLAHILNRKTGTYGVATASSMDQQSFAVLLKADQENTYE